MEILLSELNQYREGNRIEAKKAAGGLPDSIWDTYSSFANTNGGVILLGVTEAADKTLNAVGLADPEKLVKQFWDNVNNPQKVSGNILTDGHVCVVGENGVRIIRIDVPRADRRYKPVYIGADPFKGTYRRNGEGDYHCTREDVLEMIRDQSDASLDSKVLDDIAMDAINMESLAGYRRWFETHRPGHVWLKLADIEFLIKLGAAKHGKDNGLHPTAAGLLMFGDEYQIVYEFPQYFLDYREVAPGQERWVHRFTSGSGDWSGNLFDFYFRAYNRIQQIIPTPFKLDANAFRVDDTSVHKAVREALANCLANSYFYGPRGIVIIRGQQHITFSNPGSFRIALDEAISGGISDPRNATLMKMFNLLDIGERAGSGIPSVFSVWNEQGWSVPVYEEAFNPDRTTLTLILANETDKISDKTLSENLSETGLSETDLSENLSEAGLSENLSEREVGVLALIKENPQITSSEIAEQLDVTRQTVTNRVRSLKEKGVILRVGSDTKGYWRVVDMKTDDNL
jgi:predicted HTH transcriptional regulator